MPVEYVGRPVKRLEDLKLITGADPYVSDVRLDGAFVRAVVRSPYGHARLVRVDTGPAHAVRGVVGAWSAGSRRTAWASSTVPWRIRPSDALAPFGVTSLHPPLTAAKLWAAMPSNGR